MDSRLKDIHNGVEKYIPTSYPTSIKKQTELRQDLLALSKLCLAVRKESLALRKKKSSPSTTEEKLSDSVETQ
jgi:hypothetical protein